MASDVLIDFFSVLKELLAVNEAILFIVDPFDDGRLVAGITVSPHQFIYEHGVLTIVCCDEPVVSVVGPDVVDARNNNVPPSMVQGCKYSR